MTHMLIIPGRVVAFRARMSNHTLGFWACFDSSSESQCDAAWRIAECVMSYDLMLETEIADEPRDLRDIRSLAVPAS
jgi:hypothetical protein